MSVSIVNTRELDRLEPCLRSLFEHPYTRGNFDVIVLNNAAVSGSAGPIKERFPRVRVVEEPTWRGFGANHNRVAGLADGDLLFILNPDAVVHDGALDLLATAMSRHPDAAVAAGPIFHPNGTTWQGSPFPFPSPLHTLGQAVGMHRLRTSGGEGGAERIVFDGWVSGAAFMVDRETFLSIGGFDERFFIYSEEIDLMLRLTRLGKAIAWVPDARVTHVGRASNAEPDAGDQPVRTELDDYELRRINQYVRSKVAYMEKNLGKGTAVAYRLALGFDASLRLALASVPALRSLLEVRGPHPEVTRQHHLTRIRAARNPNRGPFLSDLAADWNRQLAETNGDAR